MTEREELAQWIYRKADAATRTAERAELFAQKGKEPGRSASVAQGYREQASKFTRVAELLTEK